jgi:hypothetical protein
MDRAADGSEVIIVSTIAADHVSVASPATTNDVVQVRRRTVDTVLVGAGALMTVVFLVAGALLMWGSNFADDYVGQELGSQNITFADEAALVEEGRTDLVKYAGEQVTTGQEAEAYASYIDGHLEGIAEGATYADLGGPEREARTALQAAQDGGADDATVAELQATLDEVSGQRNTLFKGETLRGLLLTSYAWATVGTIAGYAAWAAFAAAVLMGVLVALGLRHRHQLVKGSPAGAT